MISRLPLSLLACCLTILSANALADSVPAGESSLIAELDYSDTFTLGEGTREGLAAGQFPVGASFPDALRVEDTHGHPEMFWSDARWSISDDANVLDGVPPWPGGNGAGSATGMTQTGGAVDFGIEYDLREDFVVQFDAVQTEDRVNITAGNVRDAIAGAMNPNGVSVFFRADGHPDLPEVGIYNDILGEVDTGFDTGLAGVRVGQWHNYAVRFNLPAKTLTVYVDEIPLGTVDLTTFGGEAVQGRGTVEPGAFAEWVLNENTNDAVSVGAAGGNRVWTDNFQIGSFGVTDIAGIRLGSPVMTRDTKGTADPADDTFSVSLRVVGLGPVSAAGWTISLPPGVTGPSSGAYGETITLENFPASAAEDVTLVFTDAVDADVKAFLTVRVPALPPPVSRGVATGESTLISRPDYSDSFTIGEGASGARNGEPYATGGYPISEGSPLLLVENSRGNPPRSWSPALWSLNNDAIIADGDPPWPGGSGAGSATGVTQTGNAVDFGLEYGLRRDFVVQFDAVQTTDRVNITAGNIRDAIAGEANPNGISIFIRADGHPSLPEVGIYNAALGEVDSGLDTGLAGVRAGQWHNYAARFNLVDKSLTVFVDEIPLGTVDLTTFGGQAAQSGALVAPGAFAALINENTHDAVSVGAAGGNRVWTDNFQVGAPAGVPVGASTLIAALDYSDTFTIGPWTGDNERNGEPYSAGAYPVGSEALLRVENSHGNPPQYWTDGRWSLNNDSVISDGEPPWPGGVGAGSATGMTQTGNAVDFGLEYDLREDFVVQFDAVQTEDRVNITAGNVRDAIAGTLNPNGISIFFRADGHPSLPEVGVYNDILGEVDTGFDTGLAGVRVGQWHNYAVRFNLPAKTLTVYVDEIPLGTVDLTTFGGEAVQGRGTVEPGAFAEWVLNENTNDAVSVGAAGGNRVWTDNFQVGAPEGAAPGDADSDGDGMSDAEELVAGTDPANPASVTRLSAPTPVAGEPGIWEARFQTVAGRFYRLYSSQDLLSWSRVDSPGTIAGNGAEATPRVTAPANAARLYYRLVIRQTDDFPPSTP